MNTFIHTVALMGIGQFLVAEHQQHNERMRVNFRLASSAYLAHPIQAHLFDVNTCIYTVHLFIVNKRSLNVCRFNFLCRNGLFVIQETNSRAGDAAGI